MCTHSHKLDPKCILLDDISVIVYSQNDSRDVIEDSGNSMEIFHCFYSNHHDDKKKILYLHEWYSCVAKKNYFQLTATTYVTPRIDFNKKYSIRTLLRLDLS